MSDVEAFEAAAETPALEQRPSISSRPERRSLDSLRTRYQASLISNVDYTEADGWHPRGAGLSLSRVKPSRILLVVVALVAAGGAAFLALQAHDVPVGAPVVAAAAPVPAPTLQVLVAKAAVSTGQRLGTDAFEWVDWPEANLRPEFITVATQPKAATDLVGNVARSEFYPGEPIRTDKLAPASGGYLSAILDKGMRGVSATVTADSASGGFVSPNDRVDVVLTRAVNSTQVSETILQSVRVLAINARLGPTVGDPTTAPAATESDVFANAAIATLELSPAQSEVIINATMLGKLSLMLRPATEAASSTTADEMAANAAIRISSPFWSN